MDPTQNEVQLIEPAWPGVSGTLYNVRDTTVVACQKKLWFCPLESSISPVFFRSYLILPGTYINLEPFWVPNSRSSHIQHVHMMAIVFSLANFSLTKLITEIHSSFFPYLLPRFPHSAILRICVYMSIPSLPSLFHHKYFLCVLLEEKRNRTLKSSSYFYYTICSEIFLFRKKSDT